MREISEKGETKVTSISKYALKKINAQISNTIRINSYFKFNQYAYFKKDIFDFFIEGEETSCSTMYHSAEHKTPLYILGTTKGRIFLFHCM